MFFKVFFKKQSGRILCSHVHMSTGLTFPVSAKGQKWRISKQKYPNALRDFKSPPGLVLGRGRGLKYYVCRRKEQFVYNLSQAALFPSVPKVSEGRVGCEWLEGQSEKAEVSACFQQL